MDIKNTFFTALDGLVTHKSRALLTILGIVIGVAAIILVMALGSGAQSLVLGEISGMGAETVVVLPGSGDFTQAIFSRVLTQQDLDALRESVNVPNLAAAMPMVNVPGTASRDGTTYTPTIMGGVAEFFVDTFDIYPAEGVIFGEDGVRSRARVAMIGSRVKDELFGEGDAVGQTFRVNDQRFRVVGVFPARGNVAFLNVDDLVVMPYTTAQTYLLGESHFFRIVLKADSAENVDRVAFDAAATLRQTHDLAPGEEDDFTIETQQGLMDQISAIVTILTAFLSLVVAISLVVGGIGIMNIMLVSVTERTKEIGLRKALGATRKDILRQFLFEAVILTGVGGLIGIAVGTLAAFVVALVLAATVVPGWSFVFPVFAAILGVGVSVIVGLVFGIYPAVQAAKKSPIEALRYE